MIVADRQLAGRGRGSNRWWTGRGSLAFSLLFEPSVWGLTPAAVPLRSLAAGVAVAAAVTPRLYPHHVGLHWPNDVYVAERKLAGILVDLLADGRHVLGIGLNVNNSLAAAPADVRDRATSMLDLTGMRHDRTAVLLDILAELASAFRQSAAEPEQFGTRFHDLCLQVGQPLVIETAGQSIAGRCLGIAAGRRPVVGNCARPREVLLGRAAVRRGAIFRRARGVARRIRSAADLDLGPARGGVDRLAGNHVVVTAPGQRPGQIGKLAPLDDSPLAHVDVRVGQRRIALDRHHHAAAGVEEMEIDRAPAQYETDEQSADDQAKFCHALIPCGRAVNVLVGAKTLAKSALPAIAAWAAPPVWIVSILPARPV